MLDLNIVTYADLPEELVEELGDNYPILITTRDDFTFISISIDHVEQMENRYLSIKSFEYSRT